jgi:hypothetical protein
LTSGSGSEDPGGHGALLQLVNDHGHLAAPAVELTSNREAPEVAGLAEARAAGAAARAVILVEGNSDQVAVETLARRVGRDLDAEGVSVLPVGGATTIGHFLSVLGPDGFDVRLAGLCDAGEEAGLRVNLERAGLGSNLTRAGLERLGFYVCDADLESELIRSLGAAVVVQVLEAEGELASFRTFQAQPAWRGRGIEEQLRRFMGTRSGRKIRYGRLLVNALDLNRVPRPLRRVLTHV